MPTYEEFKLKVMQIAAETGADEATITRALDRVLRAMKNKQ
jgi:hypothetical protein